MPSLKSLRTRIASVKATQKITKAMQMVAAAKLRRAQMAAEAARPYATRMERVLANLASGVPDSSAPPLLAGTGSHADAISSSSARPSAACAAPSTPRSRGSRATAPTPSSPKARRVKFICVGKKGYDILKRNFEKDILEVVDLRGVKQIGFGNAQGIAEKADRAFRERRVRRGDAFLRALPLGDPADPDGAARHPGRDRARRGGRRRRHPRVLRVRAGRGRDPFDSLLPRNVAVQIYRALLENVASEMGAKMSAMDSATRNAGEMIKKQTIAL